jgi:hypothetical protein
LRLELFCWFKFARDDKIERMTANSQGITPTERLLVKIARKSFLSPWSYANIFRDQGPKGDNSSGKEVCDLLVVFDNHVVIFSDKDVSFNLSNDVETAWKRWYRKAIKKSIDQIWGAEKWIKNHPERLFLDDKCKIPFPITIKEKKLKFHRIVIANGAVSACKRFFNGSSGSLLINSSLSDKNLAEDSRPFNVSYVGKRDKSIHIFNESTLDIILNELDTFRDFIDYLDKKEKLFKNHSVCASEEDLLSIYLKNTNEKQEHDFNFNSEIKSIFIEEGHWEDFYSNLQFKFKKIKNEISYYWDHIIEKFAFHARNNSQYYTTHPNEGVPGIERSLRFLANENRLTRRFLSEKLYEIINKVKIPSQCYARYVDARNDESPHYILLVYCPIIGISYEKNREIRRILLEHYCKKTKIRFPKAKDIVGFATDSIDSKSVSEDLLYFDARDWTLKDTKETMEIDREFGLISKSRKHKSKIIEYPKIVTIQTNGVVKGSDRNKLCYCGKPIKYKNCCGKVK